MQVTNACVTGVFCVRARGGQTAALDGSLLEAALQTVVTGATASVAPVELDERIREVNACLLVWPHARQPV